MGLFRYIIVMGVVAGFCCTALGEPRTWTNRNGKTAVAEFQALENGTLVLKKGSKTIRVLLEDFSDEDQAYVRLRMEEFNYKHMPRTEQSFRDHHFVVRFFDIPGMGHENVSPETLNLVLEWVEANNPRL